MAEIWKDVNGYEGLYQVSNLGRVKSLENRSNHKKEMIMRFAKIKGYNKVTLSKNSESKSYPVHRLVATAFIENPDNKPHVNHIDGDKTNNNADNLEWVTDSENIRHAIKNKLINQTKGFNNSRGQFVCQLDSNTDDVLAIYGSFRIAEKITKIPHSNIKKATTGLYLTAGGYKWKVISNL